MPSSRRPAHRTPRPTSSRGPRTSLPKPGSVDRAVVEGRSSLLALTGRLAGRRLEPEELLHQALERALSRSDQLRDLEQAEAWVARIVRNTVLDELRRERRRSTEEPAVLLEAASDPTPDLDLCTCVLAQMGRLRPAYAFILKRVVIEGAPLAEVAGELDISLNNASVRLHRAREALRNAVASHCGTTSTSSCTDCGCDERGCCDEP